MSSEYVIGWELMFHSVQQDIKTKEDILIILIHWVLIKSRFRCIGLGDDSTFTVDEPGSELLPKGWNCKNTYAIKYTLDSQLFVLRGLLVDEEFILNLVRVADKNVSTLTVNHNDVVKTTQGSLETIVPTYTEMFHSLKNELIVPLIKTSSKEATTQTTSVRPPGAHQPNLLGRSPSADIESQRSRYADPFGVGSSDLNPFAQPGHGNLFDPFNRDPLRPLPDPGQGILGGLPRGAVPPGARFDPFGPPNVGPRPSRARFPPDADHLPPPGYDDMFM
uniref:Proteasome inhibitor PI31 subunit n=1 Tax=Graphocephala atropunctata TaxID=36148 RepID=A0A1B6LA54_9HEMI